MNKIFKRLVAKASKRAKDWECRGVIPKQQERTIRQHITKDYMAGVQDTIREYNELIVPVLLAYAKIENPACYPWELPLQEEGLSEDALIDRYFKAKKALRILGYPTNSPEEVMIPTTIRLNQNETKSNHDS